MERIVGIVISLLALGIMMTIHELGHYLTGRKLGFKIEEFMIFMGPVLFAWEKNGIKYSLRLLPIGAAVQFAGEMTGADDDDEDAQETDLAINEDAEALDDVPEMVYDKNDPGLFMNRPKRFRAVVLSAGSLANILSGIIIFAVIFTVSGYYTPVLSYIPEGSQAAVAGLEVGDRIIRSNDQHVRTNLDLAFSTNFLASGDELELTVRRADGSNETITLEPESRLVFQVGITTDGSAEEVKVLGVADWQNNDNPVFQVGDIIRAVNGTPVTQANLTSVITALDGAEASYTIVRNGVEMDILSVSREVQAYNDRGIVMTAVEGGIGAIPYAVEYSWSTLKTTFRSLVSIFQRQIAAEDALTGPVGIINTIAGVVTDDGFNAGEKLLQLGNLVAVISLSLGFTNLLPIPLLDGNHLLLLLVEAIRGKQLSSRSQTVITIVGLAIIIFLFAFGLYADIRRMIS